MLMRSPVMLNASWVEPVDGRVSGPELAPRRQRAISRIEDDRVWLA
jgi:hypothetical protein